MFAAVPYPFVDLATSEQIGSPADLISTGLDTRISHRPLLCTHGTVILGCRSAFVAIEYSTTHMLWAMSHWGLNKEVERARRSTKVGTHAQGRSQRCRTGSRGGQVQALQTTNSVVSWTSSIPDRNGRVYPQPQNRGT